MFEEIIADQSPRYTNKKEKESKFSEHEKKLMRDLALLTRGHSDKIVSMFWKIAFFCSYSDKMEVCFRK